MKKKRTVWKRFLSGGILQGRKGIAAMLLLFAAATGAAVFVGARYRTENKREAEIHASGFHFSSDYLEAETGNGTEKGIAEYAVPDWMTNGITIQLYNYEKLNTAQVSDTEIKYKVKVPAGWEISSVTEKGGGNQRVIAGSDGFYIMPAPSGDEKITHTLKLEYTGTEAKVPEKAEVTVESAVPYILPLKAQFALTGSAMPTLELDQNKFPDAVTVTVYANDYDGEVTVGWKPEMVSPDNANPDIDMSDWKDSSPSGKFTVEKNHSYTLIFVKNSTKEISRDDFGLTAVAVDQKGGND